MDIEALNVELCFACVEALVLDLAFCAAVDGVGIVRAERLHVKMRSSASDLFVRGKCHTERTVRDPFLLDYFYHGKDLGDTGFVIGTENGGPVGGDECASL